MAGEAATDTPVPDQPVGAAHAGDDDVQETQEFESALRLECEARADGHGEDGFGARRMLRVLNMPDSPRRGRIMRRLKDHAKVHLVSVGAAKATGRIDFGAIDWNSFFAGLIQLLTTLLPLILKFFP